MEGDGNVAAASAANAPPKIFCTLPPLLLKQNHPASVPIKVIGTPSPEIRWFVNGVPAEQCEGYRVSTGPGRRSHPDEILTVLEISSVDQSLEGAVEVTAANDQGEDRFVVPLKTYRLLAGIYLEEEEEAANKGRNFNGLDGSRTVDRRLFRNEVDEACKGIRIYQAYDSISRSYDDCNRTDRSNDDDDPAMRQWRRKMAKRNLMKSIDDIVDSGDDRSVDRTVKPLDSQTPGNSSFRSEAVNRGRTRDQIVHMAARPYSLERAPGVFKLPRLAKNSGRSMAARVLDTLKSSKVDIDPSGQGNELFTFHGQKLSDFCGRLLRDGTAAKAHKTQVENNALMKKKDVCCEKIMYGEVIKKWKDNDPVVVASMCDDIVSKPTPSKVIKQRMDNDLVVVASTYGNVDSMYGNVASTYGNVASMHDNVASSSSPVKYSQVIKQRKDSDPVVASMCGNVDSMYGNVAPTYGDVASVCGNVASTYGNVASMCGNIASTYGSVASSSSQVIKQRKDSDPVVASMLGNVDSVCGNVTSTYDNVASMYGNVVSTCGNVASTPTSIEYSKDFGPYSLEKEIMSIIGSGGHQNIGSDVRTPMSSLADERVYENVFFKGRRSACPEEEEAKVSKSLGPSEDALDPIVQVKSTHVGVRQESERGLNCADAPFEGVHRSSHNSQSAGIRNDELLNRSAKDLTDASRGTIEGDLTTILSELNQQLEKWKVERERIDTPALRTDLGKPQERNAQCRSEYLKQPPTARISEYSRSLDELTERLANVECRKREQEPSCGPSPVPLPESKEARGTEEENSSPIGVNNPMFHGKVRLAKPQVERNPLSPAKPAIPPKPKFLKDQATSSESESSGSPIGTPRQNSTRVNLPLIQLPIPSSSSSHSSSLDNSPPSAFLDTSSSTTSSSSGSRSFTPSPRMTSRQLFPSASPSSPSLKTSPQDHPSPPSSHFDSSFTPSPQSPHEEHQEQSRFCSTKYKLPPLASPETPSPASSSPALPSLRLPLPPPLSCPGSVEMSRKKADKIWIPSKARKSFRIYKLSSRGGKSPSCGFENNDASEGKSGSTGNVSRPEGTHLEPLGFSVPAKSLELLPERRDSFTSMEKYKALSSSRKALSTKYELVTITTKEETVTLKNVDGTKFRRRSTGKTIFSNPPESLNAAERLYYLLGGGKEGKDGHDDDAAGDRSCHGMEADNSQKLIIEAYRLPPRDPKAKDQGPSGGGGLSDGRGLEESYESHAGSIMSLTKDKKH